MKIIFFILASLVLISSLVSASFKFGSADIQLQYSSGDKIQGSFNMSFSNHLNQNFTSNFIGGLDLFSLLLDSGYIKGEDFTCNPSDCKKGFAASNSQTSKIITLNNTKDLGFVLTGKDVLLTNFSLDISSDVPSSCLNQLSLDLLKDNNKDFFNSEFLNETCSSKNYGCFSDSGSSEIIIPSLGPYCEKITLPAAPAYKIGAKITNSTAKGELKMWLYNPAIINSQLGSCVLPSHASPVQELDCIVPFASKTQFDAFVCISASSGTSYKIRKENTNPCGMQGTDFSQDFQLDYEIYAQSLRYAPVNAKFDSSLFQKLNPEKENLVALLQDYIDTKYSSDCTPNCVIPFSVFGGSQTLTLDSLSIKYSFTGASGGTTEDKIYDISAKDFTINSSFLDFDFEALNFIVPNATGNATRLFNLNFGNQTIFTQSIRILDSGFSFDISPKIVLVGQDTQFSVIISNSTNITSSEWDFGDNTPLIISSNRKATHKYTEEGEFDLIVTLSRSDGQTSTKTFSITAGKIRESINSTIEKYEKRIVNLSKSLSSFPSWLLDIITENININELNSYLESIKEDYATASEDEYSTILDELLALDIPYSLSVSSSGTVPLTLSLSQADLSAIEQLSNSEASDEEELRSSIQSWMNQNFDATVSFQTISVFSDSGYSPILTKFEINLNSKNDTSSLSPYLIIGFPTEQIKFKEEYSEKSLESQTYLPVSSISSLEFALANQVSVEELGSYISPDIKYLKDIEVIGSSGKKYPTKTVIILIIIIFFIVFAVYMVLQEWYKRHYERSLFKNPNDLYNLINFIYNSRSSGLSDYEIKKKLRETGWSGEQITYALRKISGKRTGMFEIPVFKFIENKKVQQELEKRQKNPLDARFIKRPIL